MNHLNIEDFNVICRICLISKEKMTSLTNDENQMMIIIKCISRFKKLQTDNLPQQICTECLSQLRISYDFKQKFILSEKKLYDLLSKTNQSNKTKLDLRSNLDENLVLFKQEDESGQIIKKEIDENWDNENELTQKKIEFERINVVEKLISPEIDESWDNKNENDPNQKKINDVEEENKKDELNQKKIELVKSMYEFLCADKPCKLDDLVCNMCNRNFSTRENLLKHVKTHAKSIDGFQYSHICTLCDEGFYSLSSLNGHMRVHSYGPSYRCDLCPKIFIKLDAFAKHYSTTHNAKPVDCTKCSKKFVHPLLLDRHEQEAHNEVERVCEDCGEKFSTKLSFRQHRLKHYRQGIFSCMNCDKTYTRLATLRKHVRIAHKNVRAYLECNKCLKKFVHPIQLKRHEQLFHSRKETNYTCDVCGEKFMASIKLKQHKRNHLDVKDGNNKAELNQDTTELAKSMYEFLCADKPCKLDELVCNICKRNFSTRENLLAHVKTHAKSINGFEYSHFCTLCDEGFYSIRSLNGHLARHSYGPSYHCDLCSNVFVKLKALGKHYSTAHDDAKPVECTKCSKKFAHPLLVERHEQEAHIKMERVCNDCGEKFSTKLSFRQHRIQHYKQGSFSCMNCDRTYTTLETLKKHVRIAHKSVQAHLECKICLKKFIHPIQLKRHEQTFHRRKEKNYVCDVCGEKFVLPFKLKLHKKKHLDSELFKCSYCDKTYNAQQNLKRHIRLQHANMGKNPEEVEQTATQTDVDSQVCFICGKHVKYLKIHLKSHAKTENKCPVCSKIYTSKYCLQKHIKLQHPEDGIGKRVICPICNKVLAESGYLAKHMECVHSTVKRYECTFCESKYKLKSHLNQHIRNVHNNERPHKCTICEMGFFAKFSLQSHMRKHEGKRPYACDKCDESFRKKNGLVNHMKIHPSSLDT